MPRGARRRAAPSDLAGRDDVPESIGLELIESLPAGLPVGIHEEWQPRPFRIGQVDVVAGVVGEPVHLPGPEEAFARSLYLRVLERELSGRLLQDHLADVRRIDRDPADAFREELRAAVLRLADDRSGWAEALVAQRGARDADAVDVACRNTQRSGEADEEAVEIGALSAQ